MPQIDVLAEDNSLVSFCLKIVMKLAEAVSFDFIRSLVQQADAAGIMDKRSDIKKAATELSATGFFEYLRPKLFQSKLGWFGKKPAFQI